MRRNSFVPADVRQDVTPSNVFFNRRHFMQASAGAIAAGPLAACMAQDADDPVAAIKGPITVPVQYPEGFEFTRNPAYTLPEGQRAEMTPRVVAGTHNNFYEFLPGRGGPVWRYTDDFAVDPWEVRVDGACKTPMTLSLKDLFEFPHEERLYHFRCVERWAMNVPWLGFPLRALLEKVEPTDKAKYVRFVTAADKKTMPGLKESYYPWPYHEALRIDEAMHDLAFLVTGVYGEPIPKQHGAPIRLAVPWKYGYKSPKSLVRIELTERQPPTFWSAGQYMHEYGFISNVNPNIPHPRWSQAESYWLDTRDRFPTRIFNGYDAAVASMYPDEPRTPQEPLRRGQTAR